MPLVFRVTFLLFMFSSFLSLAEDIVFEDIPIPEEVEKVEVVTEEKSATPKKEPALEPKLKEKEPALEPKLKEKEPALEKVKRKRVSFSS